MITETPEVEAALDEVRGRLDGERLDLAELVVLGATEKVRRIDEVDDETIARRRKVSEWIRNGDAPIDLEAAEWVRRHGWSDRKSWYEHHSDE